MEAPQRRREPRKCLRELVPPVWIEQTTCRLQGGCSTTELRRRQRRFYANQLPPPAGNGGQPETRIGCHSRALALTPAPYMLDILIKQAQTSGQPCRQDAPRW